MRRSLIYPPIVGLIALLVSAAAIADTVPPNVPITPHKSRRRVPSVLRLKPKRAKEILRDHGFRVKFAALSNVCAGMPPRGHIVDQAPNPGTIAWKGSVVRLQDSCGP